MTPLSLIIDDHLIIIISHHAAFCGVLVLVVARW